MAMKPSTSSSATVFAAGEEDAALGAATAAREARLPSEKVMTSEPEPSRNRRRETWVFMSPSSRGAGRALDGAKDSEMGPAAAEVLRQLLLDLLRGGMWIGVEHRLRLHDHPVDAIAALHGL